MPDPNGGNPDPNAGAGAAGGSGNPDPNAGGGAKWYSTLEGDLAGHPAITKFDSPSALARGYVEVEKLTGGEKVVNPFKLSDEQRPTAMKKYNEAIGVPGDASGYNAILADPENLPEGVGFDKERFGEVAHKYGLRPDQAAGLWQEYTGEVSNGYKAQMEANDTALKASETKLRQEWGQAFDANIELASKFLRHKVKDQATFDRLNAKFSSDPDAIKLLAEYGKEFSENSIGGFKDPGSSRLTPDQAQEEYDNIVGNPKDDYYSDINSVRQRRIKYVESLVEQGANPMKIG